MNLLATNTIIATQIRAKINRFLGILPLVFMFVWFIPLIIFDQAFFKLVGANSNGIMKDDLKCFIIVVIFLIIAIFLMILGWFLGWFLNAVIMRVFFKWPYEKVKSVFLYSEIPGEWKVRINETTRSTFFKNRKPWEEWRKIGKWNFIKKYGILGWGLPMFLCMTCLPILLGSKSATLFNFILGFCIWGIGGFLMGFIHWHISEYHYKKYSK